MSGPAFLDANRQSLIDRLRGRKLTAAQEPTAIPSVTDSDVPLTSDQARIWFLARTFPGSAEYHQSVTWRFASGPEPELMEKALSTLMLRHDALRLRIHEHQGEPVQTLSDSAVPALEVVDLRQEPPDRASITCLAVGQARLREPFPLFDAPLFRVTLVRLPAGEGVLIAVVHHLIADGRSLQILGDDLTSLVLEETLPAPGPVRFIDYAAWRAARQHKADLSAQIAYWRHQLRGDLPVLDLPSDRARPAVPSRRGHTVPCQVAAATCEALRRLAADEGTTLFVVLLSIYQVFLARMSGATDVIVGTPMSCRDHPVVDRMVGMFVNTVALRADLSGEPDFRAVVRQVRVAVQDAQDHADLPFDQLVLQLGVPRDGGHSPVFQTMFGFGGLPTTRRGGPVMNDLPLDSGAAKWDLTLFLDECPHGVAGHLEYAADLFDETTARRFADIFLRLCEGFASAPDQGVHRARLLSQAELQHVLTGLNPYVRPSCEWTTLAQPFEAQSRRTPQAVALEGPEGRLHYGQLNASANRLAHELRQRGVGAGSLVAVCMERCFDLIRALLAVAKCGAAYVPLDPDLPDERIRFMLHDVRPAVVLAHSRTSGRVHGASVPLLLLDAQAVAGRSGHDPGWPDTDLVCDAPTLRPAHLLYTSGSTGQPKAVVYPVEAALAEILWLHSRYPLQGAGDANLFVTSYGFDVSIWEIFWPLYFGARVVVPAPGEQRDPRRLVALVDAHRATTLFLIPGMLDLVLDVLTTCPPACCQSLRTLFCGGATISPRLRDRFHARFPNTLLVQGYGPTEAGCVTDMVVPREPGNPRVPLGRPAANYRLYVLDPSLEPCPIGVVGECCLGGEVGIALGYHGRPAMTAERFVPDPFGKPGARMYRTGDLCRYREDGVLEHLGRMDRQIKLRGMRIEPGEIEAVMGEHPAVLQCHVLIHEVPPGGQQLRAFVARRPGQDVSPAALMLHARQRLPRHMVPPVITVLEALPLNVNNKIDIAALTALPAVVTDDLTRGTVPPANAREATLLGIFQTLLGSTDLDVESNFFDSGGHSLLLFRLISDCEAALGRAPAMADIFSGPTVRALAACLEETRDQGARHLVPLAPGAAKPLVVFVHGMGGSALPFLEVARALGPMVSSWGLQSEDWSADGVANPDLAPDSIEAMALAYAAEVDGMRGMSPVALVGWSMGGCIAFEMARHWLSRSVDVAALILLDTWVPPQLLNPGDRDRALEIVHTVEVLGREHAAAQAPVLGDRVLERHHAARARHAHAFSAYRPSWLDLDLDYVRAREPFSEAHIVFPPAMEVPDDRGWGAWARGVRVHAVPGHHDSLLDSPHAAGLAALIWSVLTARLAVEEI